MKQVRRNEEERRRLVAEWRKSGTQIAGFCEENGISAASFRRWLTEVGSGGEESFLPVVVKAAAVRESLPCRIHIGRLLVIECDEGTSGRAIETAIRAAVAACGPMLVSAPGSQGIGNA